MYYTLTAFNYTLWFCPQKPYTCSMRSCFVRVASAFSRIAKNNQDSTRAGRYNESKQTGSDTVKRKFLLQIALVFSCMLSAAWGEAQGPTERVEKIIFTGEFAGNRDIWMMDPDGTNREQLTFNPAADQSPALSPDGVHITFNSDRAGNLDIIVLNVVTGAETNLTADYPGSDGSPTFSPDGSEIAFVSVRGEGGARAIWRVPLEGGMATQVTFPVTANPSRVQDRIPSWGRVGGVDKIAFVGGSPDCNDFGSIWEIPVTAGSPVLGQEVEIIPNFGTGCQETRPHYSDDGQRIVWSHYTNNRGNGALYIADLADLPDGLPSAATQLTPHVDGNPKGTVGNDSTPHWSPDGAQIVFTRGQEGLRIVDVATQQVSAQIETGSGPDWGFVGAVQDEDGDGVLDSDDECLGTVGGSTVKENGCAIVQICPCDGFPNHGGYVACTVRAVEDFAQLGLIADTDRGMIVSTAARRVCGRKHIKSKK